MQLLRIAALCMTSNNSTNIEQKTHITNKKYRYIRATLITDFMETSIFEDAVKAYAKYCEKDGYLFSQPNERLSVVECKYVHL